MIGPMKKRVMASVFVTAVVLILIFVIISAVYIVSTNKKINFLEEKKTNGSAYVLTKDMMAGSVIASGDIQLVEIKEESVATDSYGSGEGNYLIGRRLKIDVEKRTIVTDSILYDDDPILSLDTRLQEFNMVTLPSDLNEGDYIDIRIRFQTGEDYLVVVGKRVESFGASGAESNTIFIRLNEEEIVRMGSAIIESYVNTGANLYANKYVDPMEQLFKSEKIDFVTDYENNRYQIESGERMNASGEMEHFEEKVERTNKKISDAINNAYRIKYEIYYDVITEDDVAAIKKAVADNNEELLDTYRNKIVSIQKLVKTSYPVKPEVADLIHNNPNILDEIKAKYDIASLELERQHLLSTDLTKVNEYGEIEPDEEHVNNLKESLEKEIEAQRSERQQYLLNLLGQTAETE